MSKKKILGGANFSAVATLPFSKNDLTSDLQGNISGGGGFADSYYLPVILGWNRERVAVRAMYGFLAPTGRFVAGANDNVGSGYWTHALSSGQTFYLTGNKRLVFSAFQMYEFHTVQEGTGVHPGETFDLDYSLMCSFLSLGMFNCKSASSVMSSGRRPRRPGRRYIGRVRGAVRRQLAWIRCQLGLPEAKSEFGPQVFQGICEPFDVSGILAAGFWVDQLLGEIRFEQREGIMSGAVLELDDIQSGVLRPRPAPYAAAYVLLRIDDRKAGRELMRRMRPIVASAAHPEARRATRG